MGVKANKWHGADGLHPNLLKEVDVVKVDIF